MSKRKYMKIDPTDLFSISSNKTLIRPKSISINLENRGEDFKLEYKEIFKNKQPQKNQEWTIDTTLNNLERIKDRISKYQKYFFYQVKIIKKGYQITIVSDDAFALVATILAELYSFGIRDKEDSYNIIPLTESVLKWISKANMVDE